MDRGIEFEGDLSPSDWIRPRLRPWGARVGTPVTSVVPSGYAAYVRVLHPAEDSGGEPVSWREIAAWSGRVYHPLMQFQRLQEPLESSNGLPPFDREPDVGELSPALCAALFDLLRPWTTTPEPCWFGIWDGFGQLQGERVRQAPRFSHPYRDYLLARLPIGDACRLQDRPWMLTPSLAWPDDQAWCVATEIDFDSTLVACSEGCAAALVADGRLEALQVPAEGRLDVHGDVLNHPH